MIGNSNDETNFWHKLLLSDTQVSRIREAFANNLPPNIKLSKIQISMIVLLGGFLGTLIKVALSFMKNVLTSLAKSALIPLGLMARASAENATIQNKMCRSWMHSLYLVKQAILIISNEEIYYIMKIVKSLEESSLLLKGVSETIENEVKEQRSGFLSILVGTLAASLFENMLASKGVIRAGEGTPATNWGQGTIIAKQGNAVSLFN